MSGKCYSCASSFGFFKKEVGCKNCGFSFCKDCLTHKLPIPKLKNVCSSCHKLLTGAAKKPEDPSKYSPPEAYKKRVAALEQKQHHTKPTRSHGHDVSKSADKNKHKGLSKEDIAIAERLQKLKDERKKETGPIPTQNEIEQRLAGLKEDRPAPPSAEEMAKRLAELKGQDPAAVNKPHVFKKDTRSEQAQIDDLLNEIGDEVEIDSHAVNPVSDVQQRLDHLRDKESSGAGSDVRPSNVPVVPRDYKTQSGENVDLDEMNRLMSQVAREMEVDARKAISDMEKDKELMARLGQLKKERKARRKEGAGENDEDEDDETEEELGKKYAHLQQEFDDSEDEEEAIKRILKQSLAEVAIDQEVEAAGHSVSNVRHKEKSKDKEKRSSKPKKKEKKAAVAKPILKKDESDDELSESDEFPWCCICNEDATLKCIGCDYDLYCKRCFKEGHDRLDLQDHRTFPFSPRKSKKH